MVEIMTREATSCDLKELVGKFIPEAIGKEIEKACQGVYPLQNTFVRKVKLLRAPKFDINRLMEVHGDYSAEAAAAAAAASEKVERPAEEIVGLAPEVCAATVRGLACGQGRQRRAADNGSGVWLPAPGCRAARAGPSIGACADSCRPACPATACVQEATA